MHVYNNHRATQRKRGKCCDPGIFYHNGYRCMGYEEYQAMKQAEVCRLLHLALAGKVSLVGVA